MGNCSGATWKRSSKVLAQESTRESRSLVRMAVAGQKILQPQHIGVARRTDDDGPGLSRLQKPDPAQDQRTHQALAQLGFLHHHIAQPARRHHHRLHRLDRDAVHQRGAVGQLRQLAREIAGAMLDHILARQNSRRPG